MKELFAFLKTNVFFAFAGTHGKELNQLSPLEGEGFIEQTLSRISKFAQLTKKFNPLLTEARVNKTVTAISRFTSHISRKRAAFTLAEILITLGIIGVVAALTLPTLMSKVDRRININRLKREYSVFQQAFQKIIEENDISFENALAVCTDNSTRHACLKDIFKAKLNTVQDCDRNDGENLSKCFVPNSEVKRLDGRPVKLNNGYLNADTTSGLMLNDGSSVAFCLDSKDCNKYYNYYRCGWFVIDVNGPKGKPNTWGKDLYLFFILKDRIIPADAKHTDNSCINSDDDDCEMYSDDCETGSNYGLTCASKYLYE